MLKARGETALASNANKPPTNPTARASPRTRFVSVFAGTAFGSIARTEARPVANGRRSEAEAERARVLVGRDAAGPGWPGGAVPASRVRESPDIWDGWISN